MSMVLTLVTTINIDIATARQTLDLLIVLIGASLVTVVLGLYFLR